MDGATLLNPAATDNWYLAYMVRHSFATSLTLHLPPQPQTTGVLPMWCVTVTPPPLLYPPLPNLTHHPHTPTLHHSHRQRVSCLCGVSQLHHLPYSTHLCLTSHTIPTPPLYTTVTDNGCLAYVVCHSYATSLTLPNPTLPPSSPPSHPHLPPQP